MTHRELLLLGKSSVFAGLSPEEIEQVCTCMGCVQKSYTAGEVILLQGSRVQRAGVLLRGKIRAESSGYGGERMVQSRLVPPAVFGDVLMAARERESPVTVVAEEDVRVLFVPFLGLMEGCEKNCPCHSRVRMNLLGEIAEKYWGLHRRVNYLSIRSLRGRIAEFLSDEMERRGSASFLVPYNREELASLLGVNRSALSRELGRMQAEGILSVYRSSFRIEDAQRLHAAR